MEKRLYEPDKPQIERFIMSCENASKIEEIRWEKFHYGATIGVAVILKNGRANAWQAGLLNYEEACLGSEPVLAEFENSLTPIFDWIAQNANKGADPKARPLVY